jgi:hypothetical protein
MSFRVPEGESVQIELARQSGPYQRLRARFEHAGVSEGLKPNDMLLGDLYDTALFYAGLVQVSRGLEGGYTRLLPSMQYLAWAFEQAVENAPAKLRRSFAGRFGTSTKTEELDALDRNGPLLSLPINLERLMDNPFSSRGAEFEISHYPGGILIMRDMESLDIRDRFVIRLTDLNHNEPQFYRDVFRETGLPIR